MELMLKDISVNAGKNCMFATLQDVARVYGCNYSEPYLYFLCDGLHMKYNLTKAETLVKLSEKMVMHDVQQHAKLFAEKTLCNMMVLEDMRADKIRQTITKCIENNNPVFISVSQLELDYHYRFPNISKIAIHHILAIYGINTDTDQAFIGDSNILDNYGNVKHFTDWYPLKKLCDGAIGLLWFEGLRQRDMSREEINSYAADSLRRFVFTKPEENFLYGQEAFRKSIAELATYINADNLLMEKLCLDLLFWLNAHFFCVFDFLKNVLKMSNMPQGEVDRLIIELVEVFSKWRTFTIGVTKACYGNNREALVKRAEEGLKIADLQEIVFIKVSKCLFKH